MESNLELDVTEEGPIGILAAKGYINNIGGEQMATACNELLDAGLKLFVLDLEQCRIVNSIGISILIEIIEQVKGMEGDVVFCCVTPTIAKTFHIMGLLQTSTICETREEALLALQS
jgi:anti-anti-sigma factor